jgi:uncharacterized protein
VVDARHGLEAQLHRDGGAIAAHQPQPHARPFWDALDEGRLMLPHCPVCDRYELPGALVCPECLSLDGPLEWREASGRGRVAAFVVFHRPFHSGFDPPYNVCVIELDEGPRMIGQVAESAPGELRFGLPVKARFEHEGNLPVRFVADSERLP